MTTVTPTEQWSLPYGQAWAFPVDGTYLHAPVLLITDTAKATTDPIAALRNLDEDGYSFQAALSRARRDLILVGLPSDAPLEQACRSVTEALMRAIAQRLGDQRMAVLGIRRGALAARYAAARMETERMDHQIGAMFFYGVPEPAIEELAALEKVGEFPRLPRLIEVVDPDADFDEDTYDDCVFGGAPSGHFVIDEDLGNDIIRRI